jgi:transcriptional regulator with XRE-family HTH domain
VSSDERVGQYLANQRKLRRITLEELSERTRIPRRNLERLESGAFDRDSDGFTRGFVRTVAAALGLDADEAVMRLVGEPDADEDRALRAAQRSVLLRMGLLIALALALLVGGSLLVMRMLEEGPVRHESVVYRRDAVRKLVEGEHQPQAPPPSEPE